MILAVNRSKCIVAAVFVLALMTMSCAGRQNISPKYISGETQGTYFTITYFDSLQRDFTHEIDSILEMVINSVSVFYENSIISKMNRNEDVIADDIFIDNFNLSMQIAEKTNGAYDFTIGGLIEAWGWGFSNRDEISPELIEKLKKQSGYKKVKLIDGKLIKEDPGIMLNFNAIAQGYTSDLIADFFIDNGVNDFLIDVGGELVAKGKKPDGSLWIIGVEMPMDDLEVVTNIADRQIIAKMHITDKAIVTSGNYRKFFIQDGVKYSHTIDPATGYPVTHSLLSATVIAPDAATADAWATAFMVVGLERSILFLDKYPELEGFFVFPDEKGRNQTWMSEGMKKYIIY